jgi:hypothetical protein
MKPVPRIRRMNQHLPSVASVVSRRAPSISVVSKNSSPSPHVRVRQRSLLPTGAGDRLKTSQPSPPAEIRGGRADYDAARTKTVRGAVTTRPTEAAMQPSMDACAWIHQAQDRSWRPYVTRMRTPDAAMVPHSRMCTTLGRFPTMATSIAGGASTSRKSPRKTAALQRYLYMDQRAMKTDIR